MNDDSIGYWNGKKEKIKQQYPDITDDDLNFIMGKEAEMVELLGYKLGKTKDEMRWIISAI